MDDGRVMVGVAGGWEGDGWWRKEVTEKRSCCEGSADQATRHPTGPWTPYRGLECEVYV